MGLLTTDMICPIEMGLVYYQTILTRRQNRNLANSNQPVPFLLEKSNVLESASEIVFLLSDPINNFTSQ